MYLLSIFKNLLSDSAMIADRRAQWGKDLRSGANIGGAHQHWWNASALLVLINIGGKHQHCCQQIRITREITIYLRVTNYPAPDDQVHFIICSTLTTKNSIYSFNFGINVTLHKEKLHFAVFSKPVILHFFTTDPTNQ